MIFGNRYGGTPKSGPYPRKSQTAQFESTFPQVERGIIFLSQFEQRGSELVFLCIFSQTL
jgi:hypothetical protein